MREISADARCEDTQHCQERTGQQQSGGHGEIMEFVGAYQQFLAEIRHLGALDDVRDVVVRLEGILDSAAIKKEATTTYAQTEHRQTQKNGPYFHKYITRLTST
jgi:hypothetical protein